jgi:hypothetical protein
MDRDRPEDVDTYPHPERGWPPEAGQPDEHTDFWWMKLLLWILALFFGSWQ